MTESSRRSKHVWGLGVGCVVPDQHSHSCGSEIRELKFIATVTA